MGFDSYEEWVADERCGPAHQTGAAIDAILAELRTPSIEMRHVTSFEVAEVDWPAMIDAVREGK